MRIRQRAGAAGHVVAHACRRKRWRGAVEGAHGGSDRARTEGLAVSTQHDEKPTPGIGPEQIRDRVKIVSATRFATLDAFDRVGSEVVGPHGGGTRRSGAAALVGRAWLGADVAAGSGSSGEPGVSPPSLCMRPGGGE